MIEITVGFVLVQLAIGIIGYIVHQFTNAQLGWVLLSASTITLVIPLFTLESQDYIVHYIDVLPSHVLGASIGFTVTVVIHWLRGEL